MLTVIMRTVGGIAAGIAVAIALVMAVEMFSGIVHPFPEDFQGTTEEICRHVERYPGWVLAIAAAAWGFTALASTWTAGMVGNRGCAMLIAVLLLAALVLNLLQLPYPMWFKLTCLILVPLGILFGFRWSLRKPAAANLPA